MRRIKVSDEVYAMLNSADEDANKAIGRLMSSACFYGAAYVTKKGIPVGFEEIVNKVPAEILEKFFTLAEATLDGLIKSEEIIVQQQQ